MAMDIIVIGIAISMIVIIPWSLMKVCEWLLDL